MLSLVLVDYGVLWAKSIGWNCGRLGQGQVEGHTEEGSPDSCVVLEA